VLRFDGLSTEPDTWKGFMNTNQRQHTSAGRQEILISRCSVEKEVFRARRLQQTAQPCRIELEKPYRFPIYFSPTPQILWHCFATALRKNFLWKVKPGKKR